MLSPLMILPFSADIDAILERLHQLPQAPATVCIKLAPEHCSHSSPVPLHLRLHDLCHISALQSVAGEGMTCDKFCHAVHEQATHLKHSDMSDAISDWVVHRVQSNGMTDEERKLLKFTRCNLMKLQNWSDWDTQFDAQLDNHHEAGCIGEPVPRASIRGGHVL